MRPATQAVPEVPHVTRHADTRELGAPLATPDDAAPDTREPDPALSNRDEAPADDHLDTLQDLGDEIATLAAHIHAAEHRFLTLIAEFDRLRGWEPSGHRSCAHWLAFRTGIDLGAARERVRAARSLTDLPRISASMAQGELSFAKVRALTRVATPESEVHLLELARCSTAAQLERTVRAWRRFSRHDEAELERMRHRSRCLSVFPDEEGMYLVRGRLDPEVGAMLMRALEEAGDALFRRDTAEEIEAKQRRADAVGLLAERAMTVGFGGGATELGGGATGSAGGGDTDIGGTRGGGDTNLSGTRAERYQVILHVQPATLRKVPEPADERFPASGDALGHSGQSDLPGRSDLEDGPRVSAETSRRLSCDVSVVPITEDPGGSILDVGRKSRTIPPALRRALESRDRGCRFPGCGLRFTDAHHVKHWADGGETKLDNLVLLCRFHHRLVHEEGYTAHFPMGEKMYFLDPGMRLIPDAPPSAPSLPPAPVETLVAQNRLLGIEPDYSTSSARYKREIDIPSAVFLRAVEALKGASSDSSQVGP
jgi:hypothetical protein